MHTLTPSADIAHPIKNHGGRPLVPGEEYIVTNAFAASILGSRIPVELKDGTTGLLGMHVKANAFETQNGTPFESLHRNAVITFIRGGGYGDLLMLTPMIRYIKAHRPDVTCYVSCGRQYQPLFKGLDIQAEDIPIQSLDVDEASIVIAYEEYIEGQEEAKSIHMAQHFANALSIDLKEDYRLDYKVSAEDMISAASKIAYETPDSIRKRIGIQLLASSLARTYRKMPQVIKALTDEGYEVVVFGLPGQFDIPESFENVVNLTKHNLTFRESAAVLATCNACVSPDSAMFHLAGALRVPVVGLYGPFPSKLRKTSDCQHILEGTAPCAPCFFHALRSGEFPAEMPCTPRRERSNDPGNFRGMADAGGSCIALDGIEVADIVAKVKEIAR